MPDHVVPLTLELLSPCFLGGAYQEPELRIASIRGVWRYWYRALYGQGDEQGNVEGEAELFGNTERRSAARLLMREEPRGVKRVGWVKTPGRQPSGADYLLFSMGMNQREYMEPGDATRWLLELRVRGDMGAAERAERSLVTALAFGGLGARSRRLAGAVHLFRSGDAGQVPPAAPTNTEELARRLAEFVGPSLARSATGNVREPGYHVIKTGCFRAGILQRTFQTWRQAMDDIGATFRQFRLRRQPDYKVAKALLTGQQPTGETIERAAFGLPMTFRFSDVQGKLDVKPTNSDRRGSPLCLTLERVAGNRLAVVWCRFRARLTPDDLLSVGAGRNGRLPAPGPETVDRFLDASGWESHEIAR